MKRVFFLLAVIAFLNGFSGAVLPAEPSQTIESGPPLKTAEQIISNDQIFTVSGLMVSCENVCPFEEQCVQESILRVINFYRELGFYVPEKLLKRKLHFVFQELIHFHGMDLDYAIGIFDPDSSTILMCSYYSSVFSQCTLFGYEGSQELYRSIIVHETAHFINSVISPGLHPTLDEAVAATVQFSLMDEQLRKLICASVKAPIFRSYRDISMGAYIYGPEGFLVACYMYMHVHTSILKRCLNQKCTPVKDPFLLNWN